LKRLLGPRSEVHPRVELPVVHPHEGRVCVPRGDSG
jgi:hypothetical protein